MPFDFQANREVEDINKITEDFRPFYKEKDDGTGWVLSDDPQVQSAVKVISGLFKTVSDTRRERDTFRGRAVDLGPLSEFGQTPDEIAEAVRNRIEEARSAGRTDEDLQAAQDRLRRELQSGHDSEKTKWTERERFLVSEIEKLTLDTALDAALGDRAVSRPVAKKVLRDFLKAEPDPETGTYRTIVPDERGDPRRRVSDGQLFTAEDLVKECMDREDFQILFKSEAPNGSGSKPGSSQRRVPSGIDPNRQKSAHEKIRDGLSKRGV